VVEDLDGRAMPPVGATREVCNPQQSALAYASDGRATLQSGPVEGSEQAAEDRQRRAVAKTKEG
jgi:hypothetical protein